MPRMPRMPPPLLPPSRPLSQPTFYGPELFTSLATKTMMMMMALQNTTSHARSRSAKIACSAAGHRANVGAVNSRRAAVLLGLAGGMAIASPRNAHALIPDGTSVFLSLSSTVDTTNSPFGRITLVTSTLAPTALTHARIHSPDPRTHSHVSPARSLTDDDEDMVQQARALSMPE